MAEEAWAGGGDLPWLLGIPMLRAWRRLAFRLEVSGLEHLPAGGAVLVVANHVSFRDPLLLVALAHDHGRRLRALVVEAAFGYPVTGWFLRSAGMIRVPAAAGRARAASAAEAALAAGEAVLVYPEGTIPRAGQVVTAQPGVGWLALRSGAPVLPVASLGMERVGPAVRLTEWLARGLRRRPVRVVVGTPVPLDDLRQSHLRGSADRAEPSVLARLAAERCLAAVRSLAVSPAPPNGPGR
jgi:1-acyl-sn-glycerol-3-phosphate acyltransferase